MERFNLAQSLDDDRFYRDKHGYLLYGEENLVKEGTVGQVDYETQLRYEGGTPEAMVPRSGAWCNTMIRL